MGAQRNVRKMVAGERQVTGERTTGRSVGPSVTGWWHARVGRRVGSRALRCERPRRGRGRT
ncbi:hypothetical protein FTX61_14810 [Nitriliruptoraceae bacterium ZYF776]|nr:hypothetical protein [Profundirhabdus halotolerans]